MQCVIIHLLIETCCIFFKYQLSILSYVMIIVFIHIYTHTYIYIYIFSSVSLNVITINVILYKCDAREYTM